MPKSATSAFIRYAGLSLAALCSYASAQADEARSTVEVGYAGIFFNSRSGNLTGPPGTTPPGATAKVVNSRTLALTYEYQVAGPWSFLAQMGLPPILKFDGDGTAAVLGRVGTARAWFPAALAIYSLNGLPQLQPYVGAGLNETFFTDRRVTAGYTTAFGGTSSTSSLKSSLGPVAKLGVKVPVAQGWLVDLAYSHYWIKTKATISTQTPGAGVIARRIGIKGDPDVLALTLGYRF
jgi:outer membrane protein